MANLDPNQFLGILHGKLGGLVFVRNADGTIHVRHLPVREADFTAGELSNQARFRLAGAYVKKVRQQPDVYAVYQAAAILKRKRACDLANADFRYPPTITEVDLSACTGQLGQPIRIEAIDDFAVTSVTVALTQIDGLLLEHGPATLQEHGSTWVYLTQTPINPGQTIVVNASEGVSPASYDILRLDLRKCGTDPFDVMLFACCLHGVSRPFGREDQSDFRHANCLHCC